jgi:hypothetical protein
VEDESQDVPYLLRRQHVFGWHAIGYPRIKPLRVTEVAIISRRSHEGRSLKTLPLLPVAPGTIEGIDFSAPRDLVRSFLL